MINRIERWLTAQAEKRPDSPAAAFEQCRITYGDLEKQSNRVARALAKLGCEPGDRVALLLPKSIEALVAMFGAMKARCVYVPLDTASPAKRLGRILDQCESRCLLTVSALLPRLEELLNNGVVGTSPVIGWMDSGHESVKAAFSRTELEELDGAPVAAGGTAQDPLHILFTSGSTGEPKGVVITHDNVIQFVEWAVKYFGMSSTDRVSCHSPLHFDLSTFDVYGSVAAGAEVHLLPPQLSLLPHRLAAYIRDKRLTQWFSAPSILTHMAKLDTVQWNDFPELRRLLWCGEKFPTPSLIHWMRRVPHAAFYNLYGPTEATIASSYYHVPQVPRDAFEEIPIGEACAGEQLLVLNDRHESVPDGEVGDLYIAGVGLSPGYWRDPAKTAQAFLTNPMGANSAGAHPPGDPARIYKTGDLARRESNGVFYLLGRGDTQIKSRGHRIELGEIESALHRIPEVQDAVVVAVETGTWEGLSICCAFVPAKDSGLTPAVLRKKLSEVLPSYMLPDSWSVLEKIPLNTNGKADRPLIKKSFSREDETARAQSAGANHAPAPILPPMSSEAVTES